MPTRYLKPGICDSKHIDSLSPEAECLYYRILVNVDDFGRLDARPLIIKARCFPLREDLKSSTVEKWLKELAIKGLTHVYTCMDEPFLQLNKWDNKPRAAESKFPAYNDQCIHLYTDVPLTETVTKTKTVTKTVKPTLACRPDDVSKSVWDDFILQRKTKFTQTALNGLTNQAMKAGISVEAALKEACDRGWQSFKAAWMNNIRTSGAMSDEDAMENSGAARWLKKEQANGRA